LSLSFSLPRLAETNAPVQRVLSAIAEHLVFTFSDQIPALFKFCYYHVSEVRCIRSYFDFKTACTIATVLSYKLNYCNSATHCTRFSSTCMVTLARPPTRSSFSYAAPCLTNSPLISASLVRHSLLHFLLSHMAVHHLYHLYYHRLHLLLLAQYFILNSRLSLQ